MTLINTLKSRKLKKKTRKEKRKEKRMVQKRKGKAPFIKVNLYSPTYQNSNNLKWNHMKVKANVEAKQLSYRLLDKILQNVES